MARELLDRMAYEAMERAATSNNNVAQASNKKSATANGSPRLNAPDQSSDGVVRSFKQKIAHNIEQYTNFLGLPLFRRRRTSDRPEENETIVDEEDDFEFVENIELTHLDGFIYGAKEPGKGHQFEALHLEAPTWCDQCGDFIWGVYKHCVKCKHCQYTCHTKCRPLVMLDCKSISPENRSGPPKSTSMLFDDPPSPPTRSSKDDADSGYNSGRLSSTQPPPGERTLTRDDLRKQIDAFNTNQHGLLMTLHENDVTFQGFIRVHMNLIRPISMSISTRPPSIYEVLTHEDQDTLNDDTGTQTTSFYLPKDTTKVIHIKSETTTQELIRALLQKFKITDNPRKFALYEKVVKDGKMRKLGDAERPLPLCLTWTAEGLNQHRFVLQENDTMEIQWEAFSLPELENFLRILDREEAEYVDQVKAKYGLMKIHVQQRLKDMGLVHSDKRQPVFV